MRAWIVALPVALWVVTVAVAGFFFVHGHTGTGSDGRTSVLLQAHERDFVLSEMRGLLAAVRDITAALAENNPAGIAAAARGIGMAATHDAPPTLLAKLPLEFKRMAMPLHDGFDELAKAADRGEPVSALTGRLAHQLDRCAACHGAYRFE
ncbi:MAG: hypothetical protein HYU60_05170 [Magnetospirillum sp.]|nr:hypothetical protein [Magnetospirillum sp.]